MHGFVTLEQVRHAYGGAGTQLAVDDLTLAIDKGDFAAVVGPSGCGKSTLMKLATGLQFPQSGVVTVAGQVVDTANRFSRVVNGEIDLLCGAATITMSRREFVDFSIPIFVDGAAVMLPTGAEANFAALAGQKIGVRGSTTTEEALQNTLTGTGTEAEVVRFDTHEEGFAAMEAGEIAAYFADQSILLYLNRDSQDFMVMDRLLTVEQQGLAMLRGDAEFRFMVDGALSGMFMTGIMEQIFRENLPGIQPGQAMQWLSRLSPILP